MSKKMKQALRLLTAGLSVCMLLPACGACGPANGGNETAPVQEDTTETPTEPVTEAPTEPATEPVPGVAGVPFTDFVIYYTRAGEKELNSDVYTPIVEALREKFGTEPTLVPDLPRKPAAAHEIVIGNPADRPMAEYLTGTCLDPWQYRLREHGGSIYVCGGGTYALQYAAHLLTEYIAQNSFPEGLSLSGTAYGKQLFPLTEGADVRLMSNNTWNCDSNKWQSLGEDCSAQARFKGLCAVYLACEPDVLCFQEMTAVMINFIKNALKAEGRPYELLTYVSGSEKPYTCILYRSDRLKLLEQGHHDFAYGNDSNSKGYTWGYFEIKESGKRFVALSTHMWWKSESAQAGSNQWREDQANEIVAATAALQERLKCPIFAMGDFNCATDSKAFKNFLSGGFSDTFDLVDPATGFRDDNMGYHSCSASGYARETSNQPYKGKSIDHIIVRNLLGTKILRFDHARPYFYIKLSDHYPVFVDVVIGQ